MCSKEAQEDLLSCTKSTIVFVFCFPYAEEEEEEVFKNKNSNFQTFL